MTTRLFIPDPNDEGAHDRPGAICEINLRTSGGVRSGLWNQLSEHYKTVHYPHRPPLMVTLPSGEYWVMDQVARNGPGWEITGEVPNLTARPSILSPMYHGWLTDGVLSDDLEGRTYDEVTTP